MLLHHMNQLLNVTMWLFLLCCILSRCADLQSVSSRESSTRLQQLRLANYMTELLFDSIQLLKFDPLLNSWFRYCYEYVMYYILTMCMHIANPLLTLLKQNYSRSLLDNTYRSRINQRVYCITQTILCNKMGYCSIFTLLSRYS